MAAGRAFTPTGYTIERQEGDVLKLEIIEKNVIIAGTGAMGLAQRFNHRVETTIKELREPFRPSVSGIQGVGFIGSKVQQIFTGKVEAGTVLYDALKPVEIGTVISEAVIEDFKRTQSTQQISNGWGFGALFAFVHGDQPHLVDFDPVQFHSELKGQPDPERGDQDRIWRCVTWGRGQQLGDAFLAHVYRLLFGKKVEDSNEWIFEAPPKVAKAKVAVAWTVDHVRRYNTGLVGGKLQLAVLEKRDGVWTANHEGNLEEIRDR
jgi:hypothetical protein